MDIISVEIDKLIQKGVISVSDLTPQDFFSTLFVRPKKDGSYRTILNLKCLNEECETYHFKIESIKQVIHMITPGCYLASIDIKDAFYSVPIHTDHRKYLKFKWKGTIYQFDVMPNGYLDAMRVFTKLLKPVFARLRELGHQSVIYVDDGLLKGDTEVECTDNVRATTALLEILGFYIHLEKSSLIPSQTIVYLGFVINTVNMTISLTKKKKDNIKSICKKLLDKKDNTIREVASLIGNMTASFEAVQYGRLHYRNLELDKIISLKANKGNFEACCHISNKGKKDIIWWREHIGSAFKSMCQPPEIDYTIFTDASNEGWGAHNQDITINGRWNEEEKKLHINELELTAIYFSLLSFLKNNKTYKHVRIMSDNATSIAYINNKGGCKSEYCNNMSQRIWEFCIERGLHVSAAHIPGTHNITADIASRQFKESAEWMLCPSVFKSLCDKFGTPEIDLFATRLNKQLPKYVSWLPDPGSAYVDAMSIKWSNIFTYIFPPFSMLWPVIKKIKSQSEQAIVIAPMWPTQTWFPALLQLAVKEPLVINSTKLQMPGTGKRHPLSPKMRLIAVFCSNNTAMQETFLTTQKRSYQQHGEKTHRTNTLLSSRNLHNFVVKGKLLQCKPI